MGTFEALEAGDPRRVGRYRIVARLGVGGMGRVYLGHSPGGRLLAVKVVRPELAEDGEFRRRFAREVAAARRVNGAFTAGVVDADPEGSPAWLATVYVPSLSLREAVDRHGPWPQEHVLVLGAGLAEGLEVIHAAGVVHRDLKPSNVLLAADGPRVIDFGISVASDASTLTRTGMLVGSPGFMSPEQLTGQPVGPACDVFALGAVLTFTATGVGPFGSGSVHGLNFRTVYEEPDLGALPPALRAVVAPCLAKESDRRPGPGRLLDQLAEAAGGMRATTHALTEADWMPEAISRTVRLRITATPSPAPRPGPTPAPSSSQQQSAPPAIDPVPSKPTKPDPPGPTELPSTRSLTRRRLLLGLGATGLAASTGYFLTGDAAAGTHTLTGHTGFVYSVAFSPDGKTLASGSGDGTVRLWDVAARKQLGVLTDLDGYWVTSVAFSPDGKTLASGNYGGGYIMRLWDVATRKLLGAPLTGSGGTATVAFSPDGETIASAGYGESGVRLWDVATRKPLGPPLNGNSKALTTVAFSPDGKTFASGGEDGTVRLWDVASRKQLGVFTNRDPWVHSVMFSPDGRTLAGGSGDGEVGMVWLWDVATRKQLGPPLTGHSGAVVSVAFSPDGKCLASGSNDTTVWLWSVAARKQLGPPLTGHSGAVVSVAFSPDGKTLASGSEDRTVRLWRGARSLATSASAATTAAATS
ncbi:protein kinase [Streptomyces sp. NPDC058739]|uniref:WD40 repeat domain-containing serine/threonine protein kinase n=1 Tax=Streptomyces sp. NPDC058739 TaxID=3346618 RepID=UPI00369A17E3